MSATSTPLPQAYQYFWYDEIDSTNQEALRKSSEPWKKNPLVGHRYLGSWFCAKRQTGGRGSSGRKWLSDEGNLAASLLTRTTCAPEQLAQISLLAALAGMTAIEQFAGDDFQLGDLCLKWPNDILLKGQKICGILIESRPSVLPNSHLVVIGIGINLRSSPPIGGVFPAGNLAQNGWNCSVEQLFVTLARSMRDWLMIWRDGADFETLRQAWLERSCHIGQWISIKRGETVHAGRFTTISPNGSLLLEDQDGRSHCFTSGHIVSISQPL